MRVLTIFLCCCLLLVSVAHAQPGSVRAPEVAAEPSISLLTIEPGDSMWERFGHTALRVRDGYRDGVFSFGAAPFLDPRFMWAFARGEGQFFVVVERFAKTSERYRRSDRTLQQQELRLPLAAKRALIDMLVAKTRPPNNRYLYDQLYDNCATRLRDLIDEASQGALRRAARLRQPNHTFRDYTLEGMAGHPVGHWALDLLGSAHQDLPVDGYAEMYLPLFLRDRVAEARVMINGREEPLAGPIEVLYQRRAEPASSGRPFAARSVMVLLAVLLGALVLTPRFVVLPPLRALSAWALAAMSVWSGLFGLLVLPMTLLSKVHNFSPNENALLFLPFDLLFTRQLYRVALGNEPMSRSLRVYFGLRLALFLYVVVFKLAGSLPQHNGAYLLIAGAFLLSALLATLRAPRQVTAAAARA